MRSPLGIKSFFYTAENNSCSMNIPNKHVNIDVYVELSLKLAALVGQKGN